MATPHYQPFNLPFSHLTSGVMVLRNTDSIDRSSFFISLEDQGHHDNVRRNETRTISIYQVAAIACCKSWVKERGHVRIWGQKNWNIFLLCILLDALIWIEFSFFPVFKIDLICWADLNVVNFEDFVLFFSDDNFQCRILSKTDSQIRTNSHAREVNC